MKKHIVITTLIVTILALISPSQPLAARKIDKIEFPPLQSVEMPDIDTFRLENGIAVYLLEDHEIPLVNAAIRLAAGAYLEPADKVGLAAITGIVMRTGGTENMTGDEIDEALESIGASIEVGIGVTDGSVGMNILSDYVDTGLEMMADILRRPVFDQDKIDLAKTQARSAISRRNDDAYRICVREFLKIIYGPESPFARHTEYATIDNISREDLADFHRTFITPENTMIALWGDFETSEMLNKINRFFGDWKSGSNPVPPLPEVEYEFKPGIYYIEKNNINQSRILIGHIGGFLGDPDYFAMVVMNNILGAGAGRLYNKVRSKQGLAYFVGGNYSSYIAYPGSYYNYCFTKSEATVKAIRSIIEEIKGMQTDPPTDEEMRLGKDSYLNSFVFKFEDKGEVISRLMDYDYYGFPSDFLFTAKENIEKITAEDVVDAARKNLHPDAFHIVVVGRGVDFDEPLSVLGKVDTIDVTIPTGEPPQDISFSEEAFSRGMNLLQKAVEACGGKENYGRIKSALSEAEVMIITPQAKIPLKTTSKFVLPDKSREIMSNPMYGEIVSVYTGKDGWIEQSGQLLDMSAEQLADAENEMFRNLVSLFSRIGNPDYRAAYIGSDEIKGRAVEILKIISRDGKQTFKLALDSETYLPVAKMYFGETLSGPGNLIQTLSEYREISGVRIPHEINVESNDQQVAEIVIKRFEINPDIPESEFVRRR
jgi:predicted Zn-dependent peptidase